MTAEDIRDTNREEADETSPLIARNAPSAPSASQDVASAIIKDDDEDNSKDCEPLPLTQIFLLCYARLVEPIAFFGIFPFINEMIHRNGGIPETHVGFYSGLIESLFSLTQMFVMIFWGRMSDTWGRKPVLVASLIGVAITTSLFGFSSTIWQMILFRCLAGVFAGTIVTVRTMISELSNAETQARAFSFFAFSGNVGIFLGPLLGGALADPAGQYGGVFKKIAFFRRHPYALPTIATGFVGASAAVVALLFIKETKPPVSKTLEQQTNGASNGNGNNNCVTKPHTTMSLLRSPGVLPVLFLYGHVMLLAFSYTAVAPVYYYTNPKHGGLGFSPFMISIFMALTGFSQAIWLLFVFPPLQRRIGTGGVMNYCGFFYPFMFACYPLMNIVVRNYQLSLPHDYQGDMYGPVFWTIGPLGTCLGVGVSMSFTAIQLALNDVSPSPETLGTLNALALTLVSGIRAFSPWVFTSIFAVGAKSHWLGGRFLVWYVMIPIAAAFGVAVRWLPEKAKGIRHNRARDD